MNRRTFISLTAALGLAALSISPSAQAADPTIVGTWELNVAASKNTDPMPKSITRTYEIVGNSEKLTGTIVTADGKAIAIGFTATLDGKDTPFQNPGADTIVLTRVDALTVSFTNKLAGKVMLSGRRVMTADGKTMSIESKGVNAAGKPVESSMVYDRR